MASRSASGPTRATRAGSGSWNSATTGRSAPFSGSSATWTTAWRIPLWPAGIVVAAFRPGVDDAAVHAAHEEAFADHYGPAETDLEEWIGSRVAHEGPDLGLWLVAWDGSEVVGGIEAVETPRGGYMGELFVRRRWRGRGIGRALMLQECAELRRRGMRHAFFAVDAANPTGALHLHESIGFRSLRGATHLFEKRIEAG